MLAMLWVPLVLLFFVVVGGALVISFVAACVLTITFTKSKRWTPLRALGVIALAIPAPIAGIYVATYLLANHGAPF